MQPIVISCFDYTTNMVKPWAEAGYLCYCLDTQHPKGETRKGNIIKVGADINCWLPPKGTIAFAAFFPPCTDVAVSGSSHFRDKGLGKLINALTLFKRSVDLAELMGAPYLIENPVSTVSSYWRKPDHYFDPCDYGDPWTKKTCLWTGNSFVMPVKCRVEPTGYNRTLSFSPSANRANLRSETPMGFATAVFEANKLAC